MCELDWVKRLKQIFGVRTDLVAEAVDESNWVKHHSLDKLAPLGYDHIEHSNLILYLKQHNNKLFAIIYKYQCMHALLIPVIVVAISFGHILHIIVLVYTMKVEETMQGCIRKES